MYESIHIHERLNGVLNVLDQMTLRGYQQANSVVTAMKELATLDQDILKAEQAEKTVKPEDKELDGQ